MVQSEPAHRVQAGQTGDDLPPRLRALCDLSVGGVREYAGRHEYDGVVQDLSPDGVRGGLAALDHAATGPEPDDPFDAAALRVAEDGLRAAFGEIEDHRRNPVHHLGNLDLTGYDRDYGPPEERAEARGRHLAAWPDAVDAAIAAPGPGPCPHRSGPRTRAPGARRRRRRRTSTRGTGSPG